jgi:glycosyltransferase involved in cell wall biosynthesis/peptidoglycan/xylan/chitin deacetylase (PgdA/CDA1 family)
MAQPSSISREPCVGAEKPPIRVLFIIDNLSLVGGAELCLLRLTQQLPRNQFECRVLTFHVGDGKLADQFDCPVDYWPVDSIFSSAAFRMIKKLRRLIREQKIDIVHTFFNTSDLWAGPIAKLFGARILISARRDMGILRRFRHDLAYRLMRGFFDQVQAVSEGVRQWTIKRDGVRSERVITIHNGIQTNVDVSAVEVERLRRLAALEPHTFVATAVANFRHVKGIDTLVRAVALVTRQAPNVKILVAGSFGANAEGQAYAESVRRLVDKLGVGQWITFLGQIDDVPALLQLTDLFVLPSRSEGLSNALLEAMRAGLPCIATAVGGNPEVVLDRKTGYLIPPDDPEALAECILGLIADPALRARMGAASRDHVLQEFSVEKMTSKVVAAYRQAMDVKGFQIVEQPPNPLTVNSILGGVASAAGVNAVLRRSLLRGRFLVLCYHGVLSRPPAYTPAYAINILKGEFEAHMKFMVNNFHLMSASELIGVLEGRQELKPRSAVISFDDGYLNNLTLAAPVLRSYGVPAIFNVSTGYISGDKLLWPDEIFLRVMHWPDRMVPLPDGSLGELGEKREVRMRSAVRIQEDCKRLQNARRTAYLEKLRNGGPLRGDSYTEEAYRFLDWDDVRELSRLGFEIGSHTISHPILSQAGGTQVEHELLASKARIEKELNRECRVLAYPNGLLRDAGATVWAAAAKAGYRAAFTLRRGLASPKYPMAIDRINVPGDEPRTMFESRAAGVYVIRQAPAVFKKR